MQQVCLKDSLVLLVHGTYAASPNDEGDAWWQQGSPCWNALQQRLPAGTRLPETGEVFHWSGENSERARSKASADLLEYLLQLEADGQSYHLVGHSHGGSVIWSTLRLATLKGITLDGLRCWTTVGTPFLHHSSRSPWHVLNLLGVVFGLALMRPAFRTMYGLTNLLWSAACGQKVEVIAKSDAEMGYMAILRAPFLAFFEWAGGSVTQTADGIRLGNFDPAGDITLLQYIFASREGLLLLAITLCCIYLFLHIALMCIRPVVESLRIRADSRLQRKAFRQYGSRWLGLWSPDDEAINGLRATLGLSLTFVKRMAPTERIYLTDNLSLLSRPYYWLLAPMFNRILRPVLDSLVSSVVVRSAQGNDRPTSQVVAVLPTPQSGVHEIPPLPEKLHTKILHEANRHAKDIAPKLRQLMGCSSFTTGLEAFSSQLSGKELVHTSYFDHVEVLDLIAMNLFWSQADQENLEKLPLGSYRQLDWFSNFKKSLGVKVNYSPNALLQSKQRLFTEQVPRSRAS